MTKEVFYLEPIKPYKNKSDYSYTLGAFPTFELLNNRPERVREVLVSPTFTDMEKLEKLCRSKNIAIKADEKTINRLSDKENVYVIGVFDKYSEKLKAGTNHLMLVNPSNMGNVGTIIRTATAFDITDIAIISPGVDVFNPKVVRGSMGAVFHTKIQYFDSYSEYSDIYLSGTDADRKSFSFMLDEKAEKLLPYSVPKAEKYTLIFGNEASGLPPEYAGFTTPLMLPQSEMVDSLNLTIAAGIGMFLFKNSGRR